MVKVTLKCSALDSTLLKTQGNSSMKRSDILSDLGYKSTILVSRSLRVDDKMSPFLGVKASFRVHLNMQVGSTSVRGILSWTVVSNQSHSILSGIIRV